MSNIVLWYDDKTKNNCVYENSVENERIIIKHLDYCKIPYLIKDVQENFDPKDLNLYIIELCNVHIKYDIFSLISKKSKYLMTKGLKLILYYPKEGHSLDSWFLRIYKNLIKNDLLKSKIYFVYGDYDIEKNYYKFLKEENLSSFLTPLYLNYFLIEYHRTTNLEEANDSLNSVRNYDFLFYNRKLRPHRILAVAELERRNLTKNSLVSLLGTDDFWSLEDCKKFIRDNGLYNDYIKSFFENFSPRTINLNTENELTDDKLNISNSLHYSVTYFSIISETMILKRFITEKVYKPIYNLHPFIIMGSHGILDILKKQGFYTFEEFFDESYDEVIDPKIRLTKVVDEIEKFVKLSNLEKQKKFESIKDKLIYNKKHFINLVNCEGKTNFKQLFYSMRA